MMIKRLLAAAALLAALCSAATAQVKVTDFPSGTPTATDIVPYVSDPAGTPVTTKATIAAIFSSYTVTPSAVPGANKQGNGSKFQLFAGSASTNDCAKFDAAGNLVSAGAPCSSTSGITSLGGQTGATQTFADADDTNVTLTISSAGDTHTFTLGWAGALIKGRQHASTVYTDQANTFSSGAQDFGGAASLKVPTGAGAAPTASGFVAYDSTSNTFKGGANGSAKTFSFTDHTHTLGQVTDAGTAAALNAPASGDAAAGEVVKGDDTRLTDARPPTSHTHPFTEITGAASNAQLPSTISSKTLDNTNTANFKGTLFTLQDAADTTKQARFDLSNITAGQTRAVNIPDAASTTAQAKGATASQFLTAMSAQGVFSAAQPGFSDISGAVTDAQVPNSITVDLAAAATALASNPADCGSNQFANAVAANGDLTCAQPAASNLSNGTTGSGAVVLANAPTFTATPTVPTPTFTAPTLGTGWAYWGSGAQAGYTKLVGEMVVLKGLLKGGASGSTIFTLPAGSRPSELHLFRCVYSNSTARVDVQADGQVVATGYADPAQLIDLSCVRFVAQQ